MKQQGDTSEVAEASEENQVKEAEAGQNSETTESASSEVAVEQAVEESAAPNEPLEAVDQDEHAQDQEPLDVKLERITLDDENHASEPTPSAEDPPAEQPAGPSDEPLYDDPSDEDDGEGEWITPSNVGLHKSRALHLIPDEGAKGKRKAAQIRVGCMTADFAMQNVLLQMGLSLVGVEGKKIDRVKTWVLRCHACFKYVVSPCIYGLLLTQDWQDM